jgi:hypothetical protein
VIDGCGLKVVVVVVGVSENSALMLLISWDEGWKNGFFVLEPPGKLDCDSSSILGCCTGSSDDVLDFSVVVVVTVGSLVVVDDEEMNGLIVNFGKCPAANPGGSNFESKTSWKTIPGFSLVAVVGVAEKVFRHF